MPFATTGPISMAALRAYHGGPAQIKLSNYYRGGGIIHNVPQNNNVPTSGQISLSNLRGSVRPFAYEESASKTMTTGTWAIVSSGRYHYYSGYNPPASPGSPGSISGGNGVTLSGVSFNITYFQFGALDDPDSPAETWVEIGVNTSSVNIDYIVLSTGAVLYYSGSGSYKGIYSSTSNYLSNGGYFPSGTGNSITATFYKVISGYE